MRLDYALYGVAIIFFLVTAISFVVVSEQNGKNLWTVSTVVFGLLSVSAGYLLKPKNKTMIASNASIAQETIPESIPKMPTMEAPAVEAPKIEAVPVAETPEVNVSSIEAPAVEAIVPHAPVEAPVVDTPSIETEVSSIKEAPSIVVEVIGLTQVKGIGEKRATQLKANGILSIEDLAKSNVADLASKLSISPKIVEKWVAGAKKLIK